LGNNPIQKEYGDWGFKGKKVKETVPAKRPDEDVARAEQKKEKEGGGKARAT